MENSNSILFYHFKRPLYHYIIPFYNISSIPNSIFIKILFFNLSLIFLSNRYFFSDSRFPRLFNSHFFPLFLPQPLAPVQHTEPHTQTHDTPIILSKPITTHTKTQTINKATHTQTQTIKPSTKPHTQKPSNQLKPTTATTPTTQATDQQIQATNQKPMPLI